MQSETGVNALRADIHAPHEEAVFNNIQFMESVHASLYSLIFSTLNAKSEGVKEILNGLIRIHIFRKKHKSSMKFTSMVPPLKKKVASVFLRAFPLLFWFLYTTLLPRK